MSLLPNAAATQVNPSRLPFALLSIPFAALTLGTLCLYFLSDQTLEALRVSMKFSDLWIESDRAALLQLDRCVDLGGKECGLAAERLKRPLAYLRAVQERSKKHPNVETIKNSIQEAGIEATPFRFRLHWFERVSQVAGLPLRNLEDSAVQNARIRGEMPPDLQTLFAFDQRAKVAHAKTPPDVIGLASLKLQIAAFRIQLETAKARFNANASMASDRLRRLLYVLVGGCDLAMFGVASWIFLRMLKAWQKVEISFRERDRQLTEELGLRLGELQTAMADKTVLLQEVQHRVKNNLSVMASLLTLEAEQSRESSAAPVLIRTRDRIHSMALVHDLLCYDGSAAELDLADYVKSLSHDVMMSFGGDSRQIQLHTSVQARLGVTEAVPCGLILNEFLTNSCKHAFPQGGGGNIWISLTENDGRVDLRFRDDGVGLPPAFNGIFSSQLGMQLVSDLTTQLDGTLEREAGSGTRFHIRFPKRQAYAE
jgi:two-component sensor histidine kinase